MSEISINLDQAGSRYVLNVDGKEAGFAAFEDHDDFRDFNHTVVHPEFQGQGLSAPLIEGALKDTVENNKKIRATCSAVQHFLSKDENAGLREFAV